MPPRKRPRNNEACSTLAPPPPRSLPADLLLDIATRSDATTLIRCAAACRLLRRRILTAALIQQQIFAGVVRHTVLARLHPRRQKRPHCRRKPLVSLVYPATPAASYFVDKGLAPFVSRRAAKLFRKYDPVTSRRGLMVLRTVRHHLRTRELTDSDLCVYDLMTDVSTFLSERPNISMDDDQARTVTSCVLLTAADGIGCSPFLLLVAKMNIRYTGSSTMRVQTTSTPSDAGGVSWGAVTESVCHSGSFDEDRGVVVLPGGVIHWITRDHKILTYDVRTGKSATVKYPQMPGGEHHLAISPDGRLRILAVEGFMISVREQLSADGWSPGATIDTKEKLRSLHPNISHYHGAKLRCWEEIRGNALLLRINRRITVVLDLETKEIVKMEDSTSPFFFVFEVDLLARLQAMTMFS